MFRVATSKGEIEMPVLNIGGGDNNDQPPPPLERQEPVLGPDEPVSDSHLFSSECASDSLHGEDESAVHGAELGHQPIKVLDVDIPGAVEVDIWEDKELGVQPDMVLIPGSDCFSDDSYVSEEWVVLPNGERVIDEVKRSARRSARSARRSARGAKP